ncbi:B-cell lymphoma 3 protein [Accipiter gentilis]|uniref:B-cell lymphoma 3 protein n=1 Tax=Astur gentilis TaxID=8957 RepID=UPI002110A766|nr:B-cell lymphoma 3 protein [Accipiter gentilis]
MQGAQGALHDPGCARGVQGACEGFGELCTALGIQGACEGLRELCTAPGVRGACEGLRELCMTLGVRGACEGLGELCTAPGVNPPGARAGTPPPGKAPRGVPLAPPPPPCAPPGLGLGFPPPPSAFFSGLRGELPLPLLGGAGAGLAAPPGVLALPPAPLALLGPPETQLAADIAAATGQDEDGDTALHIAVAQGALGAARRLVGLFLQGGRELDVYNRLRQTPLHLAVITGQPGLVRLLVAHGASPMALDRLGRTAAHLACESRSPRCLRELLRPGPRGGPDLQARNYEGLTPLHVAVSSGARENVLLLLEHGADVDAVDIKSGRSPLLHAVESNSLEMAELLIQRGASVNAQSYAGCTALHAAAGRGLLGVLRLLLRSGADCALKNYHNDTPLAVASSRQVIDILRGKASRPPPAPSSPPPPPDGPPQAPNGRASPVSPPASLSPPRTPTAANQRVDSAEPTNGVQGPGPQRGVKHEGGAGQPMGCPVGPALTLPLADAHPDPTHLYPLASPGQEAAANPLAPRPLPRPLVSLGLPANQGPPTDQSQMPADAGKHPPVPPRLRPREGRGQVGGGR